ncbi:MAG: hypothetical protein WBP81_37540 [Solirubrobacteraceae bacterium]
MLASHLVSKHPVIKAGVGVDTEMSAAREHKHGPQIGVGLFCSGGTRESARALTWSLNEIVP